MTKGTTNFTPPQEILRKYADVMVNFALGKGKGISKGDVVQLVIPEVAKPFLVEIRKSIINSGGHLLLQYLPDDEDRFNYSRDFYLHAKDHQLDFYPEHYVEGLIKQVDHIMFILAEADKHKLSEVDPKTIMRHRNGLKRYMDLRTQKENLGKLSWTIGLYGTESMAQEAGLSTEEYWNQMIKACFLDKEDPIATWKAVYEKITVYKNRLNSLGNCRLHVTGPDTDLWIKVGEDRLWKSGSGANIPSFEIFTSPDWRGTEGHIKFNQPLYYMSQKISGISMKFEKGHVVSFDAKHNKATLAAMLATENADKVGEFSLTDGRFSNITKFMAETLYDENMGGEHGNTHIALGKSYLDTYAGDVGNLDPIKADSLGFNNSIVHTDIISTAPREVTAVFADGTEKVIYAEGKFVL